MESDKYRETVLYVEPTLEKVKFMDGDFMSVRRVEVWGCGGVEAAESQRRVKEWEKKEIMRRRLVCCKKKPKKKKQGLGASKYTVLITQSGLEMRLDLWDCLEGFKPNLACPSLYIQHTCVKVAGSACSLASNFHTNYIVMPSGEEE